MIFTFYGIRKLCKLPLESFQTGGVLWFPDLTIPDPYFVMPIFATGSLLVMITVSFSCFYVFMDYICEKFKISKSFHEYNKILRFDNL